MHHIAADAPVVFSSNDLPVDEEPQAGCQKFEGNQLVEGRFYWLKLEWGNGYIAASHHFDLYLANTTIRNGGFLKSSILRGSSIVYQPVCGAPILGSFYKYVMFLSGIHKLIEGAQS